MPSKRSQLYAAPGHPEPVTIAQIAEEFSRFPLAEHQNPDKWSRQMIRSAPRLHAARLATKGGAHA